MKRFFSLATASAAAAMMLGLISCSSSGGGDGGPATITKVNPYHLKPGQRIETQDQMIVHEQRYHLHGAVTAEDYLEKFGNYYTVFWKASVRGAPMTVRFEYLQSGTGPTVHTLESQVASKKKNTSKFQVTGKAYTQNGPVSAWKASIIYNGQTVAESRSFLWK